MPAVQAIPIFGGSAALGLSATLATAEFAVDHLKDALVSMTFAGLASDIGDLKDGQGRLNSKIDAQGKRVGDQINGIKSELEGQLKQQGDKLGEEIRNLESKIFVLQRLPVTNSISSSYMLIIMIIIGIFIIYQLFIKDDHLKRKVLYENKKQLKHQNACDQKNCSEKVFINIFANKCNKCLKNKYRTFTIFTKKSKSKG